MAVFACAQCGRLLNRPDDLLGRAWQCPACGPTRVKELNEPAPSQTAELLEAEYRLGITDLGGQNQGHTEVSTEIDSGEWPPPASNSASAGGPETPPTGRFLADPRPWQISKYLVLLLTAVTLAAFVVAVFWDTQHYRLFINIAGACFWCLMGVFAATFVIGVRADSRSKRFAKKFKRYRKRDTARPDTDLGPRVTNRVNLSESIKDGTDVQPGDPTS